MKGFIYKVIRKSDGAIYIGKQSRWQTKDPSLSPSDIMGVKYFTSSKLIKDDWKANPDAYSFEVLEENITDDAVLGATEVLFITKAWEDEKKGGPAVLNQYCNEKFHRKGPTGPWTEEQRRKITESLKKTAKERGKKAGERLKGRKLSEEHKRHMSEARKGVPIGSFTEEHKKRLSEAAKKRRLPEEVREKIRKTLTGRHSTDEARANQSKALKGKPWTEEHRRKAMESLRKVWKSDEFRQKMSKKQLGKHPPEETKRKISETLKMKHKQPKEENTNE